MRCPNCGFVTSELNEVCSSCGGNLSELARRFGPFYRFSTESVILKREEAPKPPQEELPPLEIPLELETPLEEVKEEVLEPVVEEEKREVQEKKAPPLTEIPDVLEEIREVLRK